MVVRKIQIQIERWPRSGDFVKEVSLLLHSIITPRVKILGCNKSVYGMVWYHTTTNDNVAMYYLSIFIA